MFCACALTLNVILSELFRYMHGAQYTPFERQQEWGDHPCAEKMPYVCQIRIGGTKREPETPPPTTAPTRPARPSTVKSKRSGLPRDQLAPIPTPAHTEAPVVITLIMSFGGLSKEQFDRPGYRASFSAAIAQLASFDGVEEKDVHVTSSVSDEKQSGGVRVRGTITTTTAKSANMVVKDLQKWAGEVHKTELQAVFRQHMNNRVSGKVDSELKRKCSNCHVWPYSTSIFGLILYTFCA